MVKKRALFFDEILENDIPILDYEDPTYEGEFSGTLDYKEWDLFPSLMIAYVTLDDGPKIRLYLYQRRNDFFGIDKMPEGTRILITLKTIGKTIGSRAHLENAVMLSDESEDEVNNG